MPRRELDDLACCRVVNHLDNLPGGVLNSIDSKGCFRPSPELRDDLVQDLLRCLGCKRGSLALVLLHEIRQELLPVALMQLVAWLPPGRIKPQMHKGVSPSFMCTEHKP